jgi:amidase
VELVGRSATALAELVRTGRSSALEVTRAHLEQLARVEHRLGAFVVTRRRAALEEAEAVDARPDRGQLPLAGVPVAIKDEIDVAGEPTRFGSLGTRPDAARRDDPLVARLRDAGAVVVGKPRSPEFGLWGATDDAGGITVNPWDPSRAPGGSSGGAAAAVGTGVVPLALASDGLGSIRIPAAACGAFGMKPGADLLPVLLPDGSPHWFGMTRYGPITTTVADAALALDVLADADRFRSLSPLERRLEVAVSVRSPSVAAPVAAAWREAAIEAGRLLRHAGHAVRWADPPYDQRMASALLARWTQGLAIEVEALDVDVTKLQPRTRAHVELGRRLASRFPVSDEDADRWRERTDAFFAANDVLITPMAARDHLPAVAWSQRSHPANVVANAVTYPFTAAWNLADVPAASVPLWHDRGRPLAVQVVAGRGREELVLAVAALLESLVPWTRHAPGWHTPVAA